MYEYRQTDQSIYAIVGARLYTVGTEKQLKFFNGDEEIVP